MLGRNLAEILEPMAKGEDPIRIFTLMCQMIERERAADGLIASVILVDPKTGKLKVAAAPSLPDDYIAAINTLEPGPDAGSCGTAIHRSETVIVEDIATDPLWQNAANRHESPPLEPLSKIHLT